VQFDPIKPTLKPPGTKCLILKCDEALSDFASKFYLRRCTEEVAPGLLRATVEHANMERRAGEPDKAKVGRCRLTLSNPR